MVVGTAVRCRKTQKAMRIQDPRTAEWAFIHADLVLFPGGTDVLPGDELRIGSQVWKVGPVLKRQSMMDVHHLSVVVEALNAS